MNNKVIFNLRDDVLYEFNQEDGENLDTLIDFMATASPDQTFCLNFDNGKVIIRRSDVILFRVEQIVEKK